MSARTPGPWAVNGQVIWFDPGHVSGCKKIARMVLDHSSTPAEIAQSLADAEYIVTTCNAHDELVAQLGAACEALDLARTGCACTVAERASGHHVDCYVPQIKETLDSARAALAKVQSGGGGV